MSKLEELTKELCPDGVEYQPLKDFCEIRSGWGFPNIEQGNKSGDLPFYKVGDMNLPGNEHFMIRSNNYISKEVSRKLGCNPAPEGTIIFPKIGAAIGTNKKRILTVSSCYDNNVMGLIPGEKINFSYLFYLFDSIDLLNFADYSGAMPSIRKSTIGKYKIPVPPLEVQREIVRILDSFTELITELTTELTARKQQYEYYLNFILDFKNKKWKKTTLKEIADVRDGTHASPKPSDDGYKLATSKNITSGHIQLETCYLISEKDYDEINLRSKVNLYDVLFSMIGTVGEVAITMEEPNFAIKNLGLIKTDGNLLLAKYIAYWMQSDFSKTYIKNNLKGTAPKYLSLGLLRDFPIYMPDEESLRVTVKEIDHFSNLCTSMQNGLPAEIEARQKQYEYYRDQLLTFKELA